MAGRWRCPGAPRARGGSGAERRGGGERLRAGAAQGWAFCVCRGACMCIDTSIELYLYIYPVERPLLGTGEGGEAGRCGRLVPTACKPEPLGAPYGAVALRSSVGASLYMDVCVWSRRPALSLPLQVPGYYLIYISTPPARGPQVPPQLLVVLSPAWGQAWGPPWWRSWRVPRAGACLPHVSVCTRPPSPGVTGAVVSLAGAQILPFLTHSSRVSRKLQQPKCLPRQPFLLLSLRQRKENSRQHFFLCRRRRRKDYR